MQYAITFFLIEDRFFLIKNVGLTTGSAPAFSAKQRKIQRIPAESDACGTHPLRRRRPVNL